MSDIAEAFEEIKRRTLVGLQVAFYFLFFLFLFFLSFGLGEAGRGGGPRNASCTDVPCSNMACWCQCPVPSAQCQCAQWAFSFFAPLEVRLGNKNPAPPGLAVSAATEDRQRCRTLQICLSAHRVWSTSWPGQSFPHLSMKTCRVSSFSSLDFAMSVSLVFVFLNS